MKEVLDVLRQLESESSRTRKEKILKDNQSNELLKKTLLYALDPYKIYGIGTKSIDLNFKTPVGVDSYYNFFDLLDWLSVNNGGSDVAKLEVNKFISRVDEEDKEWYKRIILKDLRCGISETTVNKIFDAWIPTFDVMLAKKFEDHQHKIKGDFAVTLKIDGVRCAILKENGSIKMMSRQGQLFEDFDELLEEIKLLPDNMVYDGELLLKNVDQVDSKTLYRLTMKEVSKKGKKHNVTFQCFDIVPIEEFKKSKSNKKAIARKKIISELIGKNDEFKLIQEVPLLYVGQDKNKVYELLHDVTSGGLEGVMVNVDLPYVCKRSDAILKVKEFNECDVRVLDVIEGTNKNEGKLGSILIEFEHEGNTYTCSVGSGFSDHERELYFKQPELIVGKIVTIGYFEISQNQNDDAYSLRFPTWKSIIRTDKTEISMH